MPFTQAGQLARPAPIALPDDSIGHIAQNFRESTFGALPVLDRVPAERRMGTRDDIPVRVLGLVLERDLIKCEPDKEISHDPKSTFTSKPCTAEAVMRSDLGFVPAIFSLENTLSTLQRYDVPALPVIDGNGSYLGLISHADVLAAMNKNIRPPLVGGMATPLGVWLTDGHISAGAPTFGLFLSGILMGLCYIFSYAVMAAILYWLSSSFHTDWMVQFVSGRIGADSNSGSWLSLIMTVAQGFLFLGAFRLLPIAGTHAAEHQTVWAMERGLELIPENVKQMPRAHPRCGTNLVALAGLIEIVFQHLPSFDPGTILFALLFIYLFWRNLGEWLQNWFTTRPANAKQLQSGIDAGLALQQKYQEQPVVVTSFGRRLFNSGLVYSAAGMILTLSAFMYALTLLSQLVLKG
jgi:CBS domain-containing protein